MQNKLEGKYSQESTFPLVYSAFIFGHFCQTNYLNIYMTDLRQIFRIGRTTAVDDLSVISFSIPQGMLPQQPIFVGFIYRITYIMHFRGFIHRTDSLDAGGQ